MVLEAVLHHKVPVSEDLLTSSVFGTIKNAPPELIIDVVASAQALTGSRGPRLSAPIEWSFWPWWAAASPSNGCEPVVVVEDATHLCAIEVKLEADFGSEPDKEPQLHREWKCGQVRAAQRHKDFWLVAVTSHATLPVRELRTQLMAVPTDESHILWLSWSVIGELLQASRTDQCMGRSYGQVIDVMKMIGLAPFSGFADAQFAELDPATPWLCRSVLKAEDPWPKA